MTPLVVENDPPVTFLRRKMTGGRFSLGVVIRRYTGTRVTIVRTLVLDEVALYDMGFCVKTAGCEHRCDTWSYPIWGLQMFFCWDHRHSIIYYTTNSWLYLIWLLTEFDSFPGFDTTISYPFSWFDFFLNSSWLNMGHMQRVWHAYRGHLLLCTPGPVPL